MAYTVVDIECSPAVPCPDISFSDFAVTTPSNAPPELICKDVVSISGLSGERGIDSSL